MDKPTCQLERQVLAALKCAMKANRPDVAEHLLRALEVLCSGKIENISLAKAYGLIDKER